MFRMINAISFALVLAVSAQPQFAQAADPDAALQNKLQPYIKCINRHSSRAMDSHARYLSWIKNPDKGPTGRERVVYGLYTLYNPDDCQSGIELAAQTEPRLEALEAAGAGYAESLTALYAITTDANEYYELEDYRDDDMQRGKAMHDGLLNAYQAFSAADDALRQALDEQNDALQMRLLQRIEAKQGLTLPFHVQNLSIRAKRLVRAVTNVDDLQGAAYEPALRAYEEAYLGLRDFTQENPAAIEGVHTYSLVESAARTYLKSAKTLWRHHRDGKRWDTGERMLIDAGSPEMVEGHPARVVRDYNELIKRINRM